MGKYVRIQGRIFGPFDEDAILEMHRQGKIGRFTEFSEDKRTWTKAGETELFAPRKKVSSDTLSLDGSGQVGADPRPNGESAEWFYSVDGITGTGPFSISELKAMLHSRKIDNDTLVWRQGENASPLSSIPEMTAKTSVSSTEPIDSVINTSEDSGGDLETVCVSCGKMISAGIQFCPFCGKPQFREKKKSLKKVRRCSQCDSPIDTGASRCPRCGGEPMEESGSSIVNLKIILLIFWIVILILGALWYFFLR